MGRILVVDDEKANLKAINRLFLDGEHEVELVDNGPDALMLAEQILPDVVVLDISMPIMDGYEVCSRLKSRPETTGIMVLLLSGRAHLEDRLKGYEVNADDYMTKPFDPDELLAKINILMRLKSALDQLTNTNKNLEDLVKQKTRELMKQERQVIIAQMVQGIVHNMQNPLSASDGMARLASRQIDKIIAELGEYPRAKKELFSKLKSFMTSVTEGHERLKNLINSLLIKGRQDANTHRQELDLNEVIKAELKFLDSDMEIKNKLKKDVSLDPGLPHMYGVYSDFSQVFLNLIKNAADAMQASSRKEIKITTSHDDKFLYLVFEDSGPGIPKDIQERIFEPFYTTKPQKGTEKEGEPTGTGLGLYTCVELMKQYGGEILLESKVGAGCKFTMRLPTKKRKTA